MSNGAERHGIGSLLQGDLEVGLGPRAVGASRVKRRDVLGVLNLQRRRPSVARVPRPVLEEQLGEVVPVVALDPRAPDERRGPRQRLRANRLQPPHRPVDVHRDAPRASGATRDPSPGQTRRPLRNDDAVDKLPRDGRRIRVPARRTRRQSTQPARPWEHRQCRWVRRGGQSPASARARALPADAAAAAARAGPGRLGLPADRAGVLASASSRSLERTQAVELGGEAVTFLFIFACVALSAASSFSALACAFCSCASCFCTFTSSAGLRS